MGIEEATFALIPATPIPSNPGASLLFQPGKEVDVARLSSRFSAKIMSNLPFFYPFSGVRMSYRHRMNKFVVKVDGK